VRAFHVISTAPECTHYHRPGGERFYLKDFEILVTVLSALQWRRHNGSIKLYTDTIGAEHLRRLGLSFIWDDGIDTDTLENCTVNTSFNVFWGFARTVALEVEHAPCVVLDTDLIVWNDIHALIRAPFMALHSEFELLGTGVYVPREQLHTPPGYVWGRWDWTVSPVNTAMIYFGRDDVRRFCAQEGLKYIRNNLPEREDGCPAHAVFVEQRLYPMCASRLGIQTEFFLRDYQLAGDWLAGLPMVDGTANDTFTHLWGYKQRLMEDAQECQRFCLRMTRRILTDFPALSDKLAAIPSIARYVEEVSTGVCRYPLP
jgi:hypothetical protein